MARFKVVISIAILLLCAGLTGCGSDDKSSVDPAAVMHGFLKLEPGMTKDRVEALMGPPTIKGPASDIPEVREMVDLQGKANTVVGPRTEPWKLPAGDLSGVPVSNIFPPGFESVSTGGERDPWTYREPGCYMISLSFADGTLANARAIVATQVLHAAEVPLPDESGFAEKVAALLEEDDELKRTCVLRRLRQYGEAARGAAPQVSAFMKEATGAATQAAAALTLVQIDPGVGDTEQGDQVHEKLLYYLRVEDRGNDSLTRNWPEMCYWVPGGAEMHEALDAFEEDPCCPDSVVPALVKLLEAMWGSARFGNSRDPKGMERSLAVLAGYDSAARSAVPALEKMRLDAQRALDGRTTDFDSRDGADWFKPKDKDWVKDFIKSLDRTLRKIQ